MLPRLCVTLFLALWTAGAFAYTTYQTTQGPVKMYFGEPGAPLKSAKLTELSEPFPMKVSFENGSDKALSLDLTFRTIETFELLEAEALEPDTLTRTLELAAGETKTLEIQVVAKPGTYSAHYPVHLDAIFEHEGRSESVNIVLVVETEVPTVGNPKNPSLGQILENADELPLNVVPDRGGLSLSKLDTYRGVWNYDGKTLRILPVGFTGTEPTSAASLHRHSADRGGQTRQSLNMHPPYRGGVGNVGAEYRVKLPETTPISLSFFSAIRDVFPPEPPSDGVTFRVLVDGDNIYEKHCAETSWQEHEIELSRYSGRTVLLRLESDPGPKRNTTCDSCYWGDPVIFAGEKPARLSAEERQALFAENLAAVQSGKTDSKRTTVYTLDGGLVAAVTFGNNGFLDGVIGLGDAERQVQLDGLRVWCKGQSVGGAGVISAGPWISSEESAENAPPKPKKRPQRGGDVQSPNLFAQDIEIEGRAETLFFGVTQKGPAVQFLIDATSLDLIDRIEFGPATRHASRVYFGHGYCIEEPEAFSVSSDGHRLSTSHVGMDFDNGLSLLQATSFPPDRFVVDPKSRRYTLSVHPGTTMTLLPGLNGAMDCAGRYRPICGNEAAPGTKEKSGRFVFDVWGGRYREHLDLLKAVVPYGVTDAQFIVHNWQRWGYDNRLPDIWPPNPKLGTLEDMQETLAFCDRHGIQYGVHDNYIDFYPDAEEFGFDVTTFHENGQPQKAWNNFGIEAQSYRFRPDRLQRFLERNLDAVLPELPMSTYFVDVFSSMTPVDFYDREGNFHSRVETQAAWAKAFDTIRDRLDKAGPHTADGAFRSATTSSEAGMDSLIGHLDGADCQFMYISPEPANFAMQIRCKNWSRVPWFDIVHHKTFSLHGAGYSNRYEAGRGRTLHGIESDDYLASEILTGHALMVDWGAARRGAVRKYWLAQDLARHLADKDIVGFEFIDNNPKRQVVHWAGDDGVPTSVYVNFDKEDWVNPESRYRSGPLTVTIPQYGFFTRYYGSDFSVTCGIVRHQSGRIVEGAVTDSKNGKTVSYYNIRQKQPGAEGLLPITPKLASFEYLGENRFSAEIEMSDKVHDHHDLSLFVHCVEPRLNWHQKLKEAVLGGGYPVLRISDSQRSRWAYPSRFSVPDSLPAGRYYLVVGLYDQKGDGHRARLLGFDTGADRYAVAWMTVQRGEDGKVTKIDMEPIEWEDRELAERLLPPEEPVDFDFCKTKGAFRIEFDEAVKTATATPLPEEPATELWLKLDSEARSVVAVDVEGKKLRDVPFTTSEKTVHFTTAPGEFRYEIAW